MGILFQIHFKIFKIQKKKKKKKKFEKSKSIYKE